MLFESNRNMNSLYVLSFALALAIRGIADATSGSGGIPSDTCEKVTSNPSYVGSLYSCFFDFSNEKCSPVELGIKKKLFGNLKSLLCSSESDQKELCCIIRKMHEDCPTFCDTMDRILDPHGNTVTEGLDCLTEADRKELCCTLRKMKEQSPGYFGQIQSLIDAPGYIAKFTNACTYIN